MNGTGLATDDGAEEVRLTVAPSLFAAWCARAYGSGVADDFELPPPLSVDPDDAMPATAAAVLTLIGQAERLVSLELADAGIRLTAHACAAQGLDAALVRIGYFDESRSLDWVQLALLPQQLAADEILAWLPGAVASDDVPMSDVRHQTRARVTLTDRAPGGQVERQVLAEWLLSNEDDAHRATLRDRLKTLLVQGKSFDPATGGPPR